MDNNSVATHHTKSSQGCVARIGDRTLVVEKKGDRQFSAKITQKKLS
ncbi:hypothetical protein [Microcoleus sp. EPA2]